MDDQLLNVGVQIEPGDDTDALELDQLRRRLRELLLELDVHSVDTPQVGEAPPGTRGVDMLAAGMLVVSMVKSTSQLKSIFAVVQSWLASRPVRTVELTVGGNSLKVSGIASDEQRRLIELFIERTAAA